ncbi:unnamed protein product, partial [Schistosoma turkestanicum]
MEFMVLSNLSILTMITWTFSAISETTDNKICDKTNSCIFNSTDWSKPQEISGLVLIGMALMLALIIILIKGLHTASKRNTIFIIITLIMMIIGVGLVTLCVTWYEKVIAAIVSFSIMLFAVELCLSIKRSAGRWTTLVFLVCSALVTVGMVCSILSINWCQLP